MVFRIRAYRRVLLSRTVFNFGSAFAIALANGSSVMRYRLEDALLSHVWPSQLMIKLPKMDTPKNTHPKIRAERRKRLSLIKNMKYRFVKRNPNSVKLSDIVAPANQPTRSAAFALFFTTSSWMRLNSWEFIYLLLLTTGSPMGIWTPVNGLKTRCPGPG